MEPMKLEELMQAVGGRMLGRFEDRELTVSDVFIDSRAPKEGGLFIPLTGERFDGHAFIQDALAGGAAGCLTASERESYLPGKFYILVEDTQRALRDLARHYRMKFSIPFIGVTGSVGKTTTKDMLAAVLGERFHVLKTEGNFNNEVGLPLTLLRLDSSHEFCVLEMGMNHFGEIQYLSELVEPDVAVITNIGDSHIEFLGSRENILRAKCEIFPPMGGRGLAVLCGDDPLLLTLKGTLEPETVFCGRSEGCGYRASEVASDGERSISCLVQTPKGTFRVDIPTLGEYMIYPVLMAAAVGEHYGMTGDEIAAGVHRFAPTKMRMAIVRRGGGITILNDTYNANPQSMRAAVEVLAQAKGGKKIAVLGDMLELGSLASCLHGQVGAYLGKAGVGCLVAVGELARHIYDGGAAAGVPECHYCATKEEALPILSQAMEPGATVLVKASRAMEFETLVEHLTGITPDP